MKAENEFEKNFEDEIFSLTKTEAVRKLQQAVRTTQGSGRASYAARARPSWWIEKVNVQLIDNSVRTTGLFVSATQGKWTLEQAQAALILHFRWKFYNGSIPVEALANNPNRSMTGNEENAQVHDNHGSSILDNSDGNNETTTSDRKHKQRKHSQHVDDTTKESTPKISMSINANSFSVSTPDASFEMTNSKETDQTPTSFSGGRNEQSTSDDKENVPTLSHVRESSTRQMKNRTSPFPSPKQKIAEGSIQKSFDKEKERIKREILQDMKRQMEQIDISKKHCITKLEEEMITRKRTMMNRAQSQSRTIEAMYWRYKLKYSSKVLQMKISEFAGLHEGDPDAVLMHDLAKGVRQEMVDENLNSLQQNWGPAKTPKAGRRRERAEEITRQEIQRYRPTRDAALESRQRTRDMIGRTPRNREPAVDLANLTLEDIQSDEAMDTICDTIRKGKDPLGTISKMMNKMTRIKEEYIRSLEA